MYYSAQDSPHSKNDRVQNVSTAEVRNPGLARCFPDLAALGHVLAGLGRGLGSCISNKLLADADALLLGITLHTARFGVTLAWIGIITLLLN